MKPAPPPEEKEPLGRQESLTPDVPGCFSDLLRELAAAPLVSPKGDRETDARKLPAIGRFRLQRELRREGGGIVYEARDTELGRRVTLKLITRGAGSEPCPAPYAKEAEAAAQLSHANIAALFDMGRCERGPYRVGEFLRGESLRSRMDRAPFSASEAVSIAAEVARGLAHAHSHGVVHRDLTPESVFLCDDGAVKVLDFGVASAYGPRRLEEGELAYLPPEQREGPAEDERGDVFSLGVMLYRMISGALPFPDEVEGPAPSGVPARPLELPESPALAELAGRMVERDRLGRPRDGDEVLAALSAIQEGERVRRTALAGAARGRWRRGTALGATVALAGAALLVLVASRSFETSLARKSVVVADFENPTGDRDLDGLSSLLIASLEQSTSLTVLTRTRLLDLARQCGRGRVDRIDEELGREVARKARVAALLAPAVRQLGSSYFLELRALDPLANRALFPLRLEAKSKDAILSVIDGLSEGVRRGLGEAPESIERQRVSMVEVAGTLEAYRHYFAGQQYYNRGDYGEAKKAFEKALEIDSSFALAHVDLYWIALWSSAGEEAVAHLQAALAYKDRLPEKYRKLVLLAKAYSDFEASGYRERGPVLRQAEELAAAYPLDKDVLMTAAFALWDIRGKAGRGRSMELHRQVLVLDPTRQDAASRLVLQLLGARRCEEAVSAARGLAEEPGPVPPKLLAYSLACLGRSEDALTAARKAAAAGAGGEEALVYVLSAAQKYEEAEALLAKLTAAGADPTTRRIYLPDRAKFLAIRGRRREALELIKQTMGMSGSFWDFARRAVLDAGEGMVWRADNEADFPRERDENRALIQADRARREGRTGDAIAVYREFIAELKLEARVINDVFLAELLLKERRPGEALEQMGGPERALLALSPSAVPRGFYLRALAYEDLGQLERASRELDQLLHLWARADGDLPLLARAKELRSRLDKALAGKSSANPPGIK
jgi:tetratricopeptide (TPR) repeat protein